GLEQADCRLIVKPFTADELTEQIAQILAGPAGRA
ncbi:MAG: hypothetical protein QG602_739, partial [Verrucomicrobiota bacterium]|nr:hypothetical protein [Verrucomicrobiota bacterium]